MAPSGALRLPSFFPFFTDMSLTELRPHFPGYIDVAPTCQDTEWRWLEYFHYANGEPLQTKTIQVVSAHDPHQFWTTTAIMKEKQGDKLLGSKTHLCLTGEIAGFVAANTLSHAERLRSYYKLANNHFMFFGGVLMRPLMVSPLPRMGFDDIKNTYHDPDNPDWYLEHLLDLISQKNLPVDREQFIANVTSFSQSL